jgi:hypothetical protein
MKTLISDVLLPASAAVGLLALLLIHPATAEDRQVQPEAAATLAAVSAPAGSARQSAPVSDATDQSAAARKPAIEKRCERVERIGKFAITRCE